MLAWRRAHYHNNKQPYLDRAQAQKAALHEWYRELKKRLSCSRCPESHWACLDFHHKDRKSKIMPIAWTVRNCWSKQRIELEIKKCEVLCSNCHRKEHFPE